MKIIMASLVAFAVLLLSPGRVHAMSYSTRSHQVSMEIAKALESKYHIRVVGFGGGEMNGIERESLSFEIAPPLSITQARKIIVGCAEFYLETLNANKELRPYLAEYPFPISRITLRLFVRNADKYKQSETLNTVGLSWYRKHNQMMITYTEYGKERSKDVLVESYLDAKKLVNQEGGG